MLKKDSLEDSKKQVDDMLKSAVTSLTDFSNAEMPERTDRIPHMDFMAIKKSSEEEAIKALLSIIRFYFTDEEISTEYIQSKMSMDALKYSRLIFQLKTAEYATMKLLEQIDEGNYNTSTHRALSDLQTSQMNIVKHFAQVEVQMEHNYKVMRTEFNNKIKEEELKLEEKRQKQLESAEPQELNEVEVIPDKTIVIRGGKNLLNSL